MIIPRRTRPFVFQHAVHANGVADETWARERGADKVPGVIIDAAGTWCSRDKVDVVGRILEIDPAAVQATTAPFDVITAADWPGLAKFDAELANRLRAYQPPGSAFLAARESAFLCDGMRCGKVVQTYGGGMLVGSKQMLVTTLGTPKRGWAEDAARWIGVSALMLDGRGADDMWWFCAKCNGKGSTIETATNCVGTPVTRAHRCEACRGRGFTRPKDPFEAIGRAQIIIGNYDIMFAHRETDAAGRMQHRKDLPGWVRMIRKYANVDTLVADESHKIGSKGFRWAAMRELGALSSLRRFWTNTGTPFDGKIINLWSQLDLVTGGMWGSSKKKYAERYCEGYQSEFGFSMPKKWARAVG